MADLTVQGSPLFSSPILQLLQALVGGEEQTDQTVKKTGTDNTVGSTNQTDTGTSTQNQTQNQTTQGTQTTQGSTTQTTQGTADTSRLETVFNQQQAGITPDVLAALFAEGAKAAPGLVNATANAVGARSSNNTPLATALTQLSSNLTNQAAQLSLQQRNASAGTARDIAQLTAGTQVTGTQNQTAVNDQVTNMLAQILGNTNNTSNQTSTSDRTSASTDVLGQNVNTSIDTGNISKLLGGLLGYSALDQGLGNFGGIPGVVGSATGAVGKTLSDLLRSIGLVGNQPTDMNDAMVDGIFDSGSLFGDSFDLGGLFDSIFDSGTATGGGGIGGDIWGGFGYNSDPILTDPDWWQTENWDTWDLWGD